MRVKPRAVVLLSGGLDSTVALAMALEAYEISLALTVDYGHRAAKQEKRASQHIAAHYELPHRVMPLPWLGGLLPEAMKEDPDASGGGFPDASDDTHDPMDVRHVWVPNRNGLLINIAAALAESDAASHVIFGANLEEGAAFPDNTPAFQTAINQALSYSTLNQVQVVAPVGGLDKAAILAEGLRLGVPLALIWSCYEASDKHCGVCASCIRLKGALNQLEATQQRLAELEFIV